MGKKKSSPGTNPTASYDLPDCSPSKITPSVLPAGTELHRTHHRDFSPDQFNPRPDSNARFSTVLDEGGDVIPTIYCASTLNGSLMETLFHDIPYQSDDKFLSGSKLVDQMHSTLTTNQDISLALLSKMALRKLGVPPDKLVTSEKSAYGFSRAVAEEIYRLNPGIQGIEWISRQDDKSVAYVLFESRFDTPPLTPTGNSRSLELEAFDDVLDVAEQIGVLIVPDSV